MAVMNIPVMYEKGQLYQLNLSDLQADPNQPRKVLDPQAMEELTTSVARHGILEPILFRQDQSGLLFVVAGERRCAAARQAGLEQIPALLVDGNDSEIALVENLLRQDLTPIEEAEALQRLMEEEKYTQEQLGAMIGRARTTISESLILNSLPKEIRDDCRGDRRLAKSALVEIARKKQIRSMTKAYNTLKAKQEQGRKPREKKDPNAPQAFLDLLDKAGAKIEGVDTSTWSVGDQESLMIALAGLRDKIEARLAAPPSMLPAATKTEK
jgi:ParB family chromosome partitioning protein